MKHKLSSRLLSMMLALLLVVGFFPRTAFAADVDETTTETPVVATDETAAEETAVDVDETAPAAEDDESELDAVPQEETETEDVALPEQATEAEAAEEQPQAVNAASGSGDYYSRVISQKQYAISPGVTEKNIVYNDVTGQNQNKGYVMEIDPKNQYVSMLASYKDLGTTIPQGIYGTQVLSQQAAFAESQGYNVVGGVNTCLRWGSEEPMGMLVINGQVLHNEIQDNNYLVIFEDGTADIRDGTVPLDGSEWQAVCCFPHWLVKNGENQCTEDHSQGERAPRTAIGIKEDGSLVLFVCDGRNIPAAVGMTMYELAEVMIQLGCVKATNCDGGGSSTFLSEREGSGQLTMKNTPSDGSERATLGGLLVCSTAAPSGEFNHAAVSPYNDYFTPGSDVEVVATGVDYAGVAVSEIPADVTWKLEDESMGTLEQATIDGNEAKVHFVSNGTEGTVVVNLLRDNAVVGTTTFSIHHPDSLAFNSSSLNLKYEEVSDLGLVAKYDGNDVKMKAADISWTIEDDSAGHFEGLNFVVTDNYLASVSTKVTATYTAAGLTAETTVNIGMQPSIVMDGGDGNEVDPLDYSKGFGRVVARVNNPWGIGYWEKGSADTVDLITAHYTNNEGNCADASLWRGGNESAEYITTEMPEWTDIIRFGNGAVKLNYDFSQANGIEGACLGFSHDIELTGSPTGIGMWVYAPEGTVNLWLRGAIGVETAPGSGTYGYTFINYTERADTAWNNSNGTDVGGINWTGWHYVEADLSAYAGRTIRVMAGETVRVMYTNGKYGPTVNGVVTGMGNLTKEGQYVPKEECKGWILVDNLQFVYGANSEDVTPPVISGVQWSKSASDTTRKDLVNGTEIKAVKPAFWFDYNDNEYTDPYHSGVSTRLFYFDGMLAGGGFDVDAEQYSFLDKFLAEGQHSFTAYVKDVYGNVTTETRYFSFTYAKDDIENYPALSVDYSQQLYLGDTFELKFDCSYPDLSNVASAEAEFTLNKNFPVTDVVFSPDFDGTYTYDNGKLTIRATPKEGVETATTETFYTVKVKVPTDLPAGTQLSFMANSAYITLHVDNFREGKRTSSTWSTSTPMVYLPIQAKYTVESEVMIAGQPGVIYVKDAENKPAAGVGVYTGETLIGVTDETGKLVTDFFKEANTTASVYAKDDNGAVSFPVTISTTAPVGEETPYQIIPNVAGDTTTTKNLTWMSNPDYAKATAQMKISTNADLSGATTFEGECQAVRYAVTGVSNYVNSVTATGLKPATTYYYQVGDGETWSEIGSFTTAAGNADTKFFIIGDMQGEDAAVAATYSNLLLQNSDAYHFGVQLGDGIDNPDKYDEWQLALGVFSSGVFAQTDMIHVIGNHETFGSADSDAVTARAIYANPTGTASGYYSYEIGNVYVAVIGYTLDTSIMQASLEWLQEDAAKSDCPWKILVMHVPVYYSNSEQTDSAYYHEHLPAVAEAAGINAVFSGHDHSYARTEELNGVTYYIAGTAGEKKYTCTDNGFPFTITNGDSEPIQTPTQDYGAIYITGDATARELNLVTYNVDEAGNATVYDRLTLKKEVCEEHSYVYDRQEHLLTCSVCGETVDPKAIEFTGLVKDKETGKTMYFLAGNIMYRWKQYNDVWYYFDSEGLGVTGTRTFNLAGVQVTYEFNADGSVNHPVWMDADGHKRCYYGPDYYSRVFVELEDGTYYFDLHGYMVTGVKAIGTKAYEFGEDGKLIREIDGVYYDPDGKYYGYAIEGRIQYDTGLILWEGDYYYVRTNGRLCTWAIYVSEEKANGLLPAGNYSFGPDGKLIMRNGPALDDYGKLCYYINGVQQLDTGLVKFGDDYYYVRPNGLLCTWAIYVSEEKANGLLPAGNYSFGPDGKLIMRNGPALDDYGKLCYYINGVQQLDTGLVKFGDDYYYVRPNGLLCTWAIYVSEEKANGLLPAGNYSFGSDGKLIMRNGPALDDYGKLCYYINGIQQFDLGLVEFEGDFYYVRPNGLLCTWAIYVSAEKANGLLPAGNYEFGADGKMIR